MTNPKIYLGAIPPTSAERRALRSQALELQAALRSARPPEPTYLLLNFVAGDATPWRAIELLLLRPHAVIVGAIRAYRGPIEALPGAPWIDRGAHEPITEQDGMSPLAYVRTQRDVVRERLNAEAARLLDASPDAHPFERTIGALICAPALHPDSRVSLDIDDHRQWLKVLGLDELPGLAAMVRTVARLPDQAMRAIIVELFGGRLWRDDTRFLYELAPSRFQLRLLGAEKRKEGILALIEGENVVGRRKNAQHYEYRLTITGDDLISSDHARIICEDDGRVVLRDTSKNGTWVVTPDGQEERVRGERVIAPHTMLRLGMTHVALEMTPADYNDPT